MFEQDVDVMKYESAIYETDCSVGSVSVNQIDTGRKAIEAQGGIPVYSFN